MQKMDDVIRWNEANLVAISALKEGYQIAKWGRKLYEVEFLIGFKFGFQTINTMTTSWKNVIKCYKIIMILEKRFQSIVHRIIIVLSGAK